MKLTMRNIIRTAIVFGIVLLPGCTLKSCVCDVISCGGDTGNPGDPGNGDTFLSKRIEEYALFVDFAKCEKGVIVAKSRQGNTVDLCSREALSYPLVHPRILKDAVYHIKDVPLVAIAEHVGATDEGFKQLMVSKKRSIQHANSAYWGIKHRTEKFLKLYRDQVPYPEFGSQEFDAEIQNAEFLLNEFGIEEDAE